MNAIGRVREYVVEAIEVVSEVEVMIVDVALWDEACKVHTQDIVHHPHTRKEVGGVLHQIEMVNYPGHFADASVYEYLGPLNEYQNPFKVD